MICTIKLLLLLPSSDSETASHLHKDGPNLPAQLRTVIAGPRFDVLRDVRFVLQQSPGAPSLETRGISGSIEVERHMREILAPWDARGILSVEYRRDETEISHR